jgi:hypothetical protein
MDIWSILQPFNKFDERLVYFVLIWYIFPILVCCIKIWQPCKNFRRQQSFCVHWERSCYVLDAFFGVTIFTILAYIGPSLWHEKFQRPLHTSAVMTVRQFGADFGNLNFCRNVEFLAKNYRIVWTVVDADSSDLMALH